MDRRRNLMSSTKIIVLVTVILVSLIFLWTFSTSNSVELVASSSSSSSPSKHIDNIDDHQKHQEETPPSKLTKQIENKVMISKRMTDSPSSSSSSSSSSAKTISPVSSSTTTSWNTEESHFDKKAALQDRMHLSESGIQLIKERNAQRQPSKASLDENIGKSLKVILREKGCNPERFIFVNTHTFGRHHNQLQEILHIIAFARRLNRTAILGFFRAAHKWWGPAEFYDFSLIMQRECVVTPFEFKSLWSDLTTLKRRRQNNVGSSSSSSSLYPTAICLGQGTKATPLSRTVKCSMEPGVPSHYSSKTGFQSTKETFYGNFILKKKHIRDADFLGVSGEIAFFMRPGILEMSRLLASIKPSLPILTELRNFYKKSSGLQPHPIVAKFWFSDDQNNNKNDEQDSSSQQHRLYFALHLRQRERDCMKEMNDVLEANTVVGDKKLLTTEQEKHVKTQCAIPVSHVTENLMLRYDIPVKNTKFFLASDHENMVLENALVKSNDAKMYSGKFEHKSLYGLAMDFFLLVGARYFSGNQLSSISQNVCMMRLGLSAMTTTTENAADGEVGLSSMMTMSGCQGCVLNFALLVYNPIDVVV